jgi:hypothetical protein
MTDYNGWTNYETWRVHLELTSNMQSTYLSYCAFMNSLIREKMPLNHMAIELEKWTIRYFYPINSIYNQAHKNYYMLAYDIVSRFMLSVNWEHIVQSYLDETSRENDYTNRK